MSEHALEQYLLNYGAEPYKIVHFFFFFLGFFEGLSTGPFLFCMSDISV